MRATIFIISLVVCFAAGSSLCSSAQSYDPAPPVAPTSMQECEALQAEWDAKTHALHKEANVCGESISHNCGTSTDCLRREMCWGCWPEHTVCGDVFVMYKRCEPMARAAVCAETSEKLQLDACRLSVRQYEMRQKSMQDAAPTYHSEAPLSVAPTTANLGTTSSASSPPDASSSVTETSTLASREEQLWNEDQAQRRDMAEAAVRDWRPTRELKTDSALGSSGMDLLQDPFSPQPGEKKPGYLSEENWEKAQGLAETIVDAKESELEKRIDALGMNTDPAGKEELELDRSTIKGLSRTLKAAEYANAVRKGLSSDSPDGWSDLISDLVQDGGSAALKRLFPSISAIWEGPIGTIAGILSDSTETAKPEIDSNPELVVKDSAHYTFQQREEALKSMFSMANRHPELWPRQRLESLYGLAEQLYNAADNPQISLRPR